MIGRRRTTRGSRVLARIATLGLLVLAVAALAAGCTTTPGGNSPNGEDDRPEEPVAPRSDAPAELAAAARRAWEASNRAREADRSAEARELARRGIEWADRAREAEPDLADAHLAWALCTGALLQTQSLPSMGRLPEMRDAALSAARLEPSLRGGAPHRFLARLYARAPGWPVSFGDAEEAVRHGRLALEQGPDRPDNKLALALALSVREAGDDREEARELLREVRRDPAASAEDRAEARELLTELR